MKARSRRLTDQRELGELGSLHERLRLEFPIWKLVTRKVASLQEVETWDWDDITKANSMLDWQEDTQEAFQLMLQDRIKPREA